MRFAPVSDEIRELSSFQALRRGWAPFLMHDPVSNEHWGRLYTERAEFQFVLLDGDEVVAEANTIPVAGMPSGWRDAFPNGFGDEPPDRLCALAVLVDPDRQAGGIARTMLGQMRAIGQAHGFPELVAPVRPTLKHRYPLVSIERYVEWRREDGLLFDPWLRTHERLGASVVGIAPEAMRIPGTVAEWEEWAAMSFPESGRYVVPGALTVVDIDRERDEGLYVEPNVWMRHPLDG